MRRAVVIAALALVPASAWAQDGEGATDASAAAVDATDEAVEPVAQQEIGPRLGVQVGAGAAAPGGLRAGGVFLYRLDERTWFEGEASFSFGGGGAACWYDRSADLTLVCDHGAFDGFGMSLGGGVRMFFDRQPSGFHPFVRGGLSIGYVRFADDAVSGVPLTISGGAGLRFRVADRVAVLGEALALVAPGLYNRDLGLLFSGGLVVQFGVELAL
jgi:hypothetical protein